MRIATDCDNKRWPVVIAHTDQDYELDPDWSRAALLRKLDANHNGKDRKSTRRCPYQMNQTNIVGTYQTSPVMAIRRANGPRRVGHKTIHICISFAIYI